MTRKKTTGRRARPAPKPKHVEIFERTFAVEKDGRVNVDGHLLTREQFEQLRESAQSRFAGLKDGAEWDRERKAFALALSDLLWKHQPTSTVKETLGVVYSELSDISLALVTLREYPYYMRGAAGRHGIQALAGFRADLLRLAEALCVLHTAMTEEGNLKLQDMIVRRQQFDAVLDPTRTLSEILVK